MASLEVNGSVSPVMKGHLPLCLAQCTRTKGRIVLLPQAAPSEAASLERKGEGGGHWDRLLLELRLCRVSVGGVHYYP